METASLRIKFTPFIQEYTKNKSKCCVEIVPEVSCIQNMNRLDWHEKSEFLEYTIPMTYKIILKKKNSVDEPIVKLEGEKVYHSCVDLPPNYSSSYNLDCRDLMRIISDTFVYYDNFNSLHDTELTVSESDNAILKSAANSVDKLFNAHEDADDVSEKLSENTYVYIDVETNVDVMNSNHDLGSVTNSPNDLKNTQLDADVMINGYIKKSSTNISIDNEFHKKQRVDASTSQSIKEINYTDINSKLKIASSCSKIQLSKESSSDCGEITTQVFTNASKTMSLRQLTVTPIFSIDTIENPVYNSFRFLSDPMIYHIFEADQSLRTNNKFDHLLLNKNYENISNKNLADIKYRNRFSIPNGFLNKRKRELPEVRVANFLKKMETEIMPLKLILQDILQKCSTMGLLKTKSVESDRIDNNRMTKYCKSKKQIECNRVVYSIVFDG